MRVSTQLAVGYVVAIVAVLADGVLSHVYVGAVQEDTDRIAEEWAEQDAVSGALAALRQAADESIAAAELGRHVERLETLAGEMLGGGTSPHDVREGNMLRELASLLRGAAEPGADIGAAADGAMAIALSFWQEDSHRVPQRLADIRERQRRLRVLNLSAGVALLALPLLLLAFIHRRIGRPLARIQERVEALGDLPARRTGGSSAMARLETAIAEMAEAVVARRHNLEQQVEARTEQLRHANRLGGLGRIAAAVAHEINTPLGSIGLCVDGLREAAGEEPLPRDRIERYLATVKDQVEACTSTTRKLLTYAHLRPTATAETPAGQLSSEALDLVHGHFRRRGVEVECAGDGAGRAVCGDLPQLRQVLVNLLLNAADASPRGGRVAVEIEGDDAGIRIRVHDSGPGIPDDLREQIFNPFFTTKRPGEGTGLGLSIAREIVEAHGGVLDIERPGEVPGATFRVWLPANGRAPA